MLSGIVATCEVGSWRRAKWDRGDGLSGIVATGYKWDRGDGLSGIVATGYKWDRGDVLSGIVATC